MHTFAYFIHFVYGVLANYYQKPIHLLTPKNKYIGITMAKVLFLGSFGYLLINIINKKIYNVFFLNTFSQ